MIEKIKKALTGRREANEVKCFHDDQERESAFQSVDRGLNQVPLKQIVGSVGRYHDFDRSFRPKWHLLTERMAGIRRAMETGRPIPPVHLYKIKDEYYVVDGNHRVAAAKELGYHEVEAKVLEFISSRNTLENLLYYERRAFEEKTGLTGRLDLTEIGCYDALLRQIEKHRRHLDGENGHTMDLCEAAKDWFTTIYTPLAKIISRSRLLEHFGGRSLADLYTYISVHQWEKPEDERRYGIGINELVPGDMEEFRDMMSKLKESDYPEMVREITAFILLNVAGQKEERILERLFDIDEVKEVHAVHGSVDIIAKIVLKRTLLMSDAETIGEFVRINVRQIPGIQSTQTLIPSNSLTKEED